MGVADDPRHVGVQIELGGKTRTLRYTVKALRLMKEATGGKNPSAPGGLLYRLEEQDPDDIATLFWALLYSEDPRPSLDEVADWIDFGNLGPILKSFNEAQQRNNRAGEPGADPQ